MAGITQNKQKALFSLWSLNKNSKNVVVSRGENSNNNDIDDSNKTNNNNNKTMIIAIIVVILLLIILMNDNINNNGNVIKNQVICLSKCFLRLCLKVFKLSVFFNVSGI